MHNEGCMTPLKILHVGCGRIAGAWLRPLKERDDVSLTGIVDINRDAAQARADEFAPDVYVGDNLGDALAELKPDVVFNATIPEAHEEVAVTALEAGCHVLVEKPLAHSMESARRMVAKATECGRQLAVCQNRRFQQTGRRARELIEQGTVGPLHSIYADYFMGIHIGGFRAEMDHALLVDMAIHHFDLARMLTGGKQAKSVYARESNPAGSGFQHGATAEALFTMEDGVHFNYRGSWNAEGACTSWNATWRLVGERGTLVWDGDDGLFYEIPTRQEGARSVHERYDLSDQSKPTATDLHAQVFDNFFCSLGEGCIPETQAADNIHSLAMVFAAIDSAESGHPVLLTTP